MVRFSYYLGVGPSRSVQRKPHTVSSHPPRKGVIMDIAIFGAAGPTGLLACREALRAGHRVRAVSRRTDPLPIDGDTSRFDQVRADAVTGVGVEAAVDGTDAVLSTLGVAYTRRPVTVYSRGTQNLVDAIRAGSRGRRLVVVSSGLTYPPPPSNWLVDHTVLPFLRGVVGRTLYADMRRMEEYLATVDDIDWTVLRPGRLTDSDEVSDYRLDAVHPSSGETSRADLAAAMVAEIDDPHLHRAMAPSTRGRAKAGSR